MEEVVILVLGELQERRKAVKHKAEGPEEAAFVNTLAEAPHPVDHEPFDSFFIGVSGGFGSQNVDLMSIPGELAGQIVSRPPGPAPERREFVIEK